MNEALLGPFLVPPFSPWAQSSPMMTRPKADPCQEAGSALYIVGKSINAGIPRHKYLGRPACYSHPSATDLSRRLVDEGVGTHMWTADVARAYRQL